MYSFLEKMTIELKLVSDLEVKLSAQGAVTYMEVDIKKQQLDGI